jgi:predicted RND superfamily exporter protein
LGVKLAPVLVTRILRQLAWHQLRRPVAVIFAVVMLAAAGIWRAQKLKLVTDFSDLLPQDQPSVVELGNILARTRGLSNVFVVLEGPDSQALRRVAAGLVPRLAAIGGPAVESARSGVQDARKFLMARAGLFLSNKDLGELEERLTDEERRAFRGAIGADLDDDGAASAPDWNDLEHRLTSKIASFSRYPDGYFQGPSPHGTAQLVVLKSAIVTGDLAGARETLARVDAVVAPALAHGGADARGVRVGYAGDLVTSMAEYELVRRDVLNVGVFGVVAVLGVLLLFFRSLRALFALGVTIAAGCAVTFGLTELVLGHLNVATAFLFSIVAGNGVNFGIIWLARFVEERQAGRLPERAAMAASRGTWSATLTAACAAAAAYAALGIGHFRGFRHFALIGASGMLLCWGVTYVLLPAVAVALERRRAAAGRTLPFAHFEMPFAWVVRRAPRATVVAAFVLASAALVAAALYLRHGPLEYDMRRLQSDSQTTGELYRVSHLAADILGAADNAGMVVLTNDAGDTPLLAATLRQRRDSAAPAEKPFEEVHTLDDLVPKDQAPRLERLRDLARRLRRDHDRGAVSEDLWAKIEPLLPTTGMRPYGVADLPPALVDLFTEKDGTRGRILFIEPTAGQSDSDLGYLLRWADAFRRTELASGRVVHGSGRAVIFADLLRASLVDMPRSILLSLLLTGATVVVLFRRRRPVAIVLGSLALALVWMLGALAAADVRLSFINFIALPITFGIGVDYPVNVYGRYAQDPKAGILRAMRGAGGAVLLCSLTTSLGYLALLRAHNQAVRSLGAVAVLGELSCVVAALVVLPAVVVWSTRRRNAYAC